MLERSMQINFLDAAAMLSDAQLLVTVKQLATNERQATAQLIAHLTEMDARRLYLGEGCSSLFTYCTQVLHLSGTCCLPPNRGGTSRSQVPGDP